MTAQKRYLSSIFVSLSTFLEGQSLSNHQSDEAHAVFTEYLVSKNDMSVWSAHDLHRFLASSGSHQTVDNAVRVALMQFVEKYPPFQTTVFLHEYLLALRADNCSSSTVKNYRSDINQFLAFANETSIEKALTKPKVEFFIGEQAKKGLKESSIRRKLVSLTQFALWLQSEGILSNAHEIEKLSDNLSELINKAPERVQKATQPQVHFSPVPTSSVPSYFTAKHTVPFKSTAQESQDLRSRIKSGLASIQKKVQPESTSNKALPYLNLAIIALFAVTLGFFGYRQFIADAEKPLAYPTSPVRPNRVLQFQGRLTDTSQNPITVATDMAFRLYDSNSGGTLLWNSGTCSVTPDQDGIFNADLGSTCGTEITENVFTENSNVWLEVQIESETLEPRQSIKTVPYALNSETIQGYPVDSTGSATKNTVVTMNNNGEVIFGEVSPTLRAVSGTFAIEAETLSLQTSSGSNGDIVLSPDGTGEVQVLSDLIVDGYVYAPGATFSATYAGGTALVVKAGPSATANIQEWQNSSSSVLSVIDANGNLGLGTTTPSRLLNVNSGTNNFIAEFESSDDQAGIILSDDDADFLFGINGTSFFIDRTTSFTSPDDFVIDANGNVGIGSISPNQALDVVGNLEFSGALMPAGVAGTSGYVLQSNGPGVAPTWVSSATLPGSGLWDVTANVFHPKEAYGEVVDLAIGGTSTASADILLQSNGNAYFSGNVGINSTNPGYRLDIDGGSGFADNWYVENGGRTGNISSAQIQFRSASNGQIGFFTNASGLTEQMTILSTGNVGIGTASPEGKFNVEGATVGKALSILNETGDQAIFVASASGTNRFIIQNDGNVGIGTSAPTALFQIASNWQGTTSTFGSTDNSGALLNYTGATTTPIYTFTGDTDTGIGRGGANILNFFTNNAEQMRIDTNGNVGIGTTTVDGQFVAYVDASNIVGVNRSTGMFSVVSDSNSAPVAYIQGTGTADLLNVFDNSTEVFTILDGGNVGVGSTSPVGKLNVNGATVGKALVILNETGDQDILTGSASGNTRFRVASNGYIYGERFVDISNSTYFVDPAAIDTSALLNGNVGIGTSTASYELDLIGEFNLTDAIRVAGDAGSNGWFLTSSGGGANTWTDPSSITGAGFWQETDGVLHPKTPYTAVVDLILGGDSTASADIHLLSDGSVIFNEQGNDADFRVEASGQADALFVQGSDGNIGIGTNTPSDKLDISAGSIRLSNGQSLRWGAGTTSLFGDSSANTLQLSTNSTTRLFIDANGNIGIGTTSPIGKLNVSGASVGKALTILNETGNQAIFVASASGTNRFIIQNNGNVGIGTAAPTSALEIGSGQVTLPAGTQGAPSLTFSGNTSTGIYLPATNTFGITTNGTEKFRVAANGNVGIGTTNPGALFTVGNDLFQVNSSGNIVQIGGVAHSISNSSGDLLINANGTSNVVRFEDNLEISTNGTNTANPRNIGFVDLSSGEAMRVTFGDEANAIQNQYGGSMDLYAFHTIRLMGNRGSLSAAPFSFTTDVGLQVINTTTGDVAMVIDGASGQTADLLQFRNNAGTALSIVNASGNVGIGTTTANYALDVNGELNLTDAIYLNGDAGTTGYILTSTAGGLNQWTNPDDIFEAGYWSLTSNVIHPKLPYTDVADVTIGGNSTASADIHLLSDGSAVFNQQGNDSDFRVETSGQANAFFIQGSDGNIGIGTNTPSTLLHLLSSTSGNLARIESTAVDGVSALDFTNDTQTWSLGVDGANNDSFRLRTNSSDLFVVQADGNVGIGSLTPTGLFNVDGATVGKALAILNETGNQAIFTASSSGTTRFIITNDGNVGIGSAAPQYDLDNGQIGINNAQFEVPDGVIFSNYTSGDYATIRTQGIDIGQSSAAGTTAYGEIESGSAYGIRLNIDNSTKLIVEGSSGNVGIGTTAPIGLFNVDGAAIGKALAILNQTGNQAIFTASSSGTTRFIIANDGNVGIGTATPAYELDVNGELNLTDAIYLNGDAGTPGFLLTSAGGGVNTWTDPADLTDAGYWDITDNVLHPKLPFTGVVDVTVGGDSTASANTHLFANGAAVFNQQGNDADFRVETSGQANALFVQGSDGNIGIGTGTPASKLHLFEATSGQTPSTGSQFVVENSGHSTINLLTGATSQGRLYFGDSGAAGAGRIIYDHSDNSFRFSTNTTEQVRLTSDGNFGIGTTNPGAKLDVVGDIYFDNELVNRTGITTKLVSSATQWEIQSGGIRMLTLSQTAPFTGTVTGNLNSHNVDFVWNGDVTSGLFTVDADEEKVGIGTNSPIGKLHVNGAAVGKALTMLNETGDQAILVASASGVNRFIIQNDGNVGIGTTAPSAKLSVVNGNAQVTNGQFVLREDDDGNNGVVIDADNDGGALSILESGVANIFLQGSGDSYFNGGNIGIGTTSPIGLLNIDGAAIGKALTILNETGNQDIFTASSSGTTRFVIANDGNVGIGTSAPGYDFDVNGDANIASAIYLNGDAGSAGYLLTSQAGGTNTWTNPVDIYTAGYFELGNNVLYPKAPYAGVVDLAIGGTSTASANILLRNDGLAYFAGNVGIGSTAPTATLDVVGSVNFDATTITFDDTNLSSPITLTDTDTGFNSGDSGIVDAVNTAYDAATGAGGGGMWTDTTPGAGAGLIYATAATDDFAVGGSSLAAAFSVDESINTIRFGDATGTNAVLNMYASDGDTGSITYNTSDQWDFVGGSVDIDQRLAIGANIGEPSSDTVLSLGQNFNLDGNSYQEYISATITSSALTADATSYGIYNSLTNNKTENTGSGFDSDGIASYNSILTSGTSTFRNNYAVYGIASNTSTAGSDLGNIFGGYFVAYQDALSGTIPLAYGSHNRVQGDAAGGSTSTITSAYATDNFIQPYNTTITNAYGSQNVVSTTDGYGGDISNAYGVYSRVDVDSDDGGNITTGRAGYFETSQRVGSNIMTNAYGIEIDANAGTTTYGAYITVDDTAPTTNYGIFLSALNAVANNYGIWGDSGDWILDADGDGIAGGTGGGGDLVLGESQDLELYHNGTDSYINNNTGDLYVQSGSNDIILANTGGNVGIGTNVPGYDLDVVGTINLTSALYANGDAGTNGYLLTSSAGGTLTWTDPDSLGSGSVLWQNSSNVYYPKDEFAGVVDLTIGGSATASADIHLLSDGSAVFNQQGNDADFRVEGSGAANALFVQGSDGNVGIGTNAPVATLDVAGRLKLDNGSNSAPAITFDANDGVGFYGQTAGGGFVAFAAGNQDRYWFTSNSLQSSNSNSFYLQRAAGSSNDPVYTFYGDDDTGLARAAADELSLVTGGSEWVRLDAAGNFGIGTTIPGAKLSVVGGDAQITNGTARVINGTFTLREDDDGNNAVLIDADNTGGDLSIYEAGVANIFLQGSGNSYLNGGNVGIGTTTPTGKLHVNGATVGKALTILNETGNQAIFTASSSGTTRFTIANSGNVGIGTSNPSAFILQTEGDVGPNQDSTYDLGSPSLRWANVYASDLIASGLWDADQDTGIQVEETSDEDMIRFDTAGSERMIITNDGNVGIGSTTPIGKFNVNGAAIGKALAIFNATGDQDIIAASASGATRFRVAQNGYVYGDRFVDISNNSYFVDPAAVTTAGTFSGNVGIGTSNPSTAKLVVQNSGSEDIFNLFDASTEVLTVIDGGNVGIGTSTPVQKLDVSGNVRLGNTGSVDDGIVAYNLTPTGIFGLTRQNDVSNASLQIAAFGGIGFSAGQTSDVTPNSSTSDLFISTSGNIGVNTTAPIGLLNVDGAAVGKALAIFNQTGDQDIIAASSSGFTRFRVANNGYVYGDRFVDISNNNYFVDPAAVTTAGTFAGNVGIGTNNPNVMLHLYDSGDMRMKFENTDGDGHIWSWANDWGGNNGFSLIEEGVNGDVIFFEAGTGDVGINTTNPAADLHINSDSGSDIGDVRITGGSSIVAGTVASLELYDGATHNGSWKLDASGTMQFQVEAGAGASANLDFNTTASNSTIRFWPKGSRVLELDPSVVTMNIGRGDVYWEDNANDNADGAGVTLRTGTNPTNGGIFAVRSSGQASRLWVGQSFTSSGYNGFYVGSSNANDSSTTSYYTTYLGSSGADSYLNLNGGNVGIGVAPSAKLDVAGDIVLSDSAGDTITQFIAAGSDHSGINLRIDGAANEYQWEHYTTPSIDYLVIDYGGSTANVNVPNGNLNVNGIISLDNASGNLYNNTAQSSYDKIRVWNNGNYTIGMASGQSFGYLNDYAMTFTMNNDTDRGFLWRDSSDSSSQGAMSLTTDGRLTVANTTNITGGQLLVTTNTYTQARFIKTAANQPANIEFVGTGGSSPSYADIAFKDYNNSPYWIWSYRTSGRGLGAYYYNGSTWIDPFELLTSNEVRVRLQNTGGGTLCHNGGVIRACSSLSKYKDNQQDLSIGLETLMQLRPVEFDWNTDYAIHDLGFIAEEVEAVNPLLAEYDKEGNLASVKYRMMTSLIVKSMQQQQAQIESNSNKVDLLMLDQEGFVQIDQSSYAVTANQTPVKTILAAAEAVVGKIRSGLVQSQDLVVSRTASIANLSVNSLTIQGMPLADYIASVVSGSVTSNGTALVSPVGEDTVIRTATVSGEIAFNNTQGQTVAAITEAGDFTASGSSSLGSLLVRKDATVSGTVTAQRVVAETSKLGTILADGPATFSATVSANSLIASEIKATSSRIEQLESKLAQVEKLKAVAAEIEKDATVSGTLYANNINGLDDKIYNATAQQKSSLLDIVTGTDSVEDINDVIAAVDATGMTATRSADLNLTLAELQLESTDVALNVDSLFVDKYFKVNGGAYVAGSLGIGNSVFVEKTVSAGESIAVANTLEIGADYIEYTGSETLEIQPSGTGSLSLMAGLVILDDTGTATVNGDFVVEQDATVKGTLFADLLKPTDLGNPLQVQVAGITDTNEVKKSRFEIIDELGTPVATISAEGKAEFAGGVSLGGGLSVGTEDLGAADLNNVDGANRPVLNSNKTSGKATIPSGTAEITIRSNKVSPDSLIYVTPVGSTNNKVLYVKSQQDENPGENRQGEFVVGFDEALDKDVHINWWIVN